MNDKKKNESNIFKDNFLILILAIILNKLTDHYMNFPDTLNFKNFFPNALFFLISGVKCGTIFLIFVYIYKNLKIYIKDELSNKK